VADSGGSDIRAVVLWMAGALTAFTTTALAVRTLAPALGLFNLLAARSVAGVVLVLAMAWFTGAGREPFRPVRLPLQFARNLVHFGATFGWSYALTVLPFATVFALEFTTPAWVTLLAVVILRERLTPTRLAAVGLGFLGVLTILRPGLASFPPDSVVMLVAAVGFALTAIATKSLTRTRPTLAILFWMNVIQGTLNLVAGRFWPGPPTVAFEPLRHGFAFAVVCLGGFASHWCLTNAYQRGDAITVIPLDFLRLPLIALVGWQFYGERLDPFVLVGGGVMLAGILANLRAETRRPAPELAARATA
jgi:drug/metabolite transporter (DMT)-like permease